jgi:hypothetical protein
MQLDRRWAVTSRRRWSYGGLHGLRVGTVALAKVAGHGWFG